LGTNGRAILGWLFLGIDNGHQLIILHLAVFLMAKLMGHIDFCLLSLAGCSLAVANFFC